MSPEEVEAMFPGSRFVDAVAIEVRDLQRAIVRQAGWWPLTDRFSQTVLDDIEVLEVPTEHLGALRELLHGIAAEVGASFVRPAEVALHCSVESPVPSRSTEVRCSGDTIAADDPRIEAVRSLIAEMSADGADAVNALVRAVSACGPRLNLLRGTTELNLVLVQAIIRLSQYDDDVRIAIVERATFETVEDLPGALAAMTRHQLERVLDLEIALVDGQLRLTFDSDGGVDLTPLTYQQSTAQGGSSELFSSTII